MPEAVAPRRVTLPRETEVQVKFGRRATTLTNLDKPFWPALGLTKRDLLQHYIDVSPWLLPHLRDRAMVMKRYPDGIDGESFFMKRTPAGAPEWLDTCSIRHQGGNVIDFPMVQDLVSLLWVVNLGCVDLNQWYARCDDTDRPDYLHFDLDPVAGTAFSRVLETALLLREELEKLGMRPLAKTSGASGLHIYVPIKRGPLQKQVWTVAKTVAAEMTSRHPKLMTVVFRVADRPRGSVLVDYNQNAWGRTLASIYSLRPVPLATVSTPVSWQEVEKGFRIADFRIDNIRARLRRKGDLWKPLLASRGRFDLGKLL
jgi:bifunctional non-homologous end joining protein LigD